MTRVALVAGLNRTPHGTSWRQPCSTCIPTLAGKCISTPVRYMSNLGKVLRVLCGPPSIPLSFSLAAVVPRRSTYRVSFDTNGSNSAHIKLTTFRAWTTRVSNPVCSPCFRPWGSVIVQWSAFAFDVLPDIYAFHRYTWNSNHLSNTLVNQFPTQFLS